MASAARLPRADGLHHGGRAGDGIPAGKDTGGRRLHADGVGLDGLPPGPLEAAQIREAVQVHPLADGGDDAVGFDDEVAAFLGHGEQAIAAVLFHELGAEAAEPREPAVRSADSRGDRQESDVDAFVLGLFQLLDVGRHLRPRAAVGDGDLLGPQPQAGARRVDGHVAAADDDRASAGGPAVAQGHVSQEVNGFDHLRVVVFPGDVELEGLVGADGEKHGLEALRLEALPAEVLPVAGVELEFNAQFLEHGDLAVDDLPGQPVARDAEHHHAAGDRQCFEHGDAVALERQVIGRRHAAGSGADHGDPLALVRRLVPDSGNGCRTWPVRPRRP